MPFEDILQEFFKNFYNLRKNFIMDFCEQKKAASK
jgi:hypothetical protein